MSDEANKSMGGRVLDLIVVLVALVGMALAVIVLVQRGRQAEAALPNIREVANWQRFDTRGHFTGDSSAPVRIVEFSDFQCPACRELHTSIAELQSQLPGLITVRYRHYPLTQIHRYAYDAAVAAECAAEQERFAEFHALLFAAQDSIGKKPWRAYALASGVSDTIAFDRCLRSTHPRVAVDTDTEAARELALSGTPGFLIGDRLIETSVNAAALRRILDKDLKAAKRRR